MKNNFKFKKGFGILEVLVASVIVIVILAALVFISRAAMANSTYTQQRAQAIYLAQEGIEIVRQVRDTNWIDENATNNNNTQWNTLKLNGTNNFVQVTTGDLVVALAPSLRYGLKDPDAGSSGEAINIDGSGTTTGTNFIRKITISNIAGNLLPDNGTGTTVYPALNAIKATAVVTWNYNGQAKTIEVSEIITNWRPNY